MLWVHRTGTADNKLEVTLRTDSGATNYECDVFRSTSSERVFQQVLAQLPCRHHTAELLLDSLLGHVSRQAIGTKESYVAPDLVRFEYQRISRALARGARK